MFITKNSAVSNIWGPRGLLHVSAIDFFFFFFLFRVVFLCTFLMVVENMKVLIIFISLSLQPAY